MCLLQIMAVTSPTQMPRIVLEAKLTSIVQRRREAPLPYIEILHTDTNYFKLENSHHVHGECSNTPNICDLRNPRPCTVPSSKNKCTIDSEDGQSPYQLYRQILKRFMLQKMCFFLINFPHFFRK